MASMMCRITAGDLRELLKYIPDYKDVGYLFSVQDGVDSAEHQVLVFNDPVKPM